MITGILKATPDTGVYIADDQKPQKISIKPGQYLYLSVHDCWIPAVVEYSPHIGTWAFHNLGNVKVHGPKGMLEH